VERVSIGLQMKMYYDLINRRAAPDISLLTYGGGPEVRFKISETFQVIGEYNIMSLENANQNRFNINYPSAGIGYYQGRGPWTFGVQLLFIISDEARDPINLNRSVDYWIEFNYNF